MSNPSGLAYAHLLNGKGGSVRISESDLPQWQAEDGLLWLHFDYTHPDAERWLLEQSGLDNVIANALLEEETRPRTTSINDGLLMSLRGINHYEDARSDDLISIRMWIDTRIIVTTRREMSYSAAELDKLLSKGNGPKNSAEFLISLVDLTVDGMSDTVAGFEDVIADYEDAVLVDDTENLHNDIAHLRRQVIKMRRYLAPERDALARLTLEKISWLSDYDRIQIHEISDNLIRYIENLDAVRERAVLVQEELHSKTSEQLNSRMYVLSVIAAVFLPLGFVTGLLGINVGGIPGANDSHAFTDVIVILCVVAVLLLFLFRWKKWF
ncbi:zinc transporter ZntB [Methylophaga sulfidovorans]|uniref:Zinc transporter n=1 Tax=Methylophaga sulfidovorans TaxID=45496 RepID=A0A1I4A7X7_9GAMM|nr:zinc transporter ZntB [Methylophaga sulfidovorans]SFK52061.1 zinc transporter [Methylophaga sulfidovorans]